MKSFLLILFALVSINSFAITYYVNPSGNDSTLGVYNGITYVANNLVFDNGARGIHFFESDNVIEVNNTCYQNCQSPSTREGELTAFSASNVTFLNNIVSPDTDVPPIAQYDASNITASNNLFTSNESLSNPLGTNTIVGDANFVNPTINFTTANFHLLQNSIAISEGTTTNAPISDKDGIIHLANGTIDLGCYEFQNSLAINNINKEIVSVFPNPVSNILNLHICDVDAFLTIHNLQEQLIYSEKNNSTNTVDFSNYQSGIYFLKINDKVVKIVKE